MSTRLIGQGSPVGIVGNSDGEHLRLDDGDFIVEATSGVPGRPREACLWDIGLPCSANAARIQAGYSDATGDVVALCIAIISIAAEA